MYESEIVEIECDLQGSWTAETRQEGRYICLHVVACFVNGSALQPPQIHVGAARRVLTKSIRCLWTSNQPIRWATSRIARSSYLTTTMIMARGSELVHRQLLPSAAETMQEDCKRSVTQTLFIPRRGEKEVNFSSRRSCCWKTREASICSHND